MLVIDYSNTLYLFIAVIFYKSRLSHLLKDIFTVKEIKTSWAISHRSFSFRDSELITI